MGFFNWSAPLFGRFADRWSGEDTELIAGWLRPYVPVRGRLLDLGGGTGALAQHLAGALECHVTVLDATPEMLSYLPAHGDVTGVLGCAEDMPFADDTFDALVVSDAFHHFRDQDGAVREMQRVVRCGGGVLVLELDPRRAMRLVVWGEKLLGEPGAFFTPEEMCAFMAERGIEGECEPQRGVSYRFLGTVR
ncbi:MAG TPA: methyltransferase domain-containing protein [Coriobacteriia bacterium]|jgi:demethylmenaquinone methyltransferase/2-methoxy-6-polyprenyl-1,4-benzoquinol methylase